MPVRLPLLNQATILAWTDSWHASTGRWPVATSGPLPGQEGETWRRVDEALRRGHRGLPGGDSLARLLSREGRARNKRALPRLTEEMVLAWAREHRARTGAWPTARSGPVVGAGEDWRQIDVALYRGYRGLPGKDTLAALLARRLGAPSRNHASPLTPARILEWARHHRARTGHWPTSRSGAVLAAAGENWAALNIALVRGSRGLSGGTSLARLLHRHLGVPLRGRESSSQKKVV
jgi:hypothetical protein